jgi:hypothetical protein
MAILGQFPPNLVFLIGILKPVRWTVAARAWSRPAERPTATSPRGRSASKLAAKRRRQRTRI